MSLSTQVPCPARAPASLLWWQSHPFRRWSWCHPTIYVDSEGSWRSQWWHLRQRDRLAAAILIFRPKYLVGTMCGPSVVYWKIPRMCRITSQKWKKEKMNRLNRVRFYLYSCRNLFHLKPKSSGKGPCTHKCFLLSMEGVWDQHHTCCIAYCECIPCFPVSATDVQEPSELGVHSTCTCACTRWTDVLLHGVTAKAHLIFKVSSQKGRWQNPSESFSGNVKGGDALRCVRCSFRRAKLSHIYSECWADPTHFYNLGPLQTP